MNKKTLHAYSTGNDFENIKTVLALHAPFLASLLRRCRIVKDESIEETCIDEHGEIRLNPAYLETLEAPERVSVYGHQALHVAFRHMERMKGRDPDIFNRAACCTVNAILEKQKLGNLPIGTITPQVIAPHVGKEPEEIAAMSVEEIYTLLLEKTKKAGGNRGNKSQGDQKQDTQEQDGSPSAKNHLQTSEGGQDQEQNENRGSKNETEDLPSEQGNTRPQSGQQSESQQNEQNGPGSSSPSSKTESPSSQSSQEKKSKTDNEAIIQQGDAEAYDAGKTPEEQEAFWKQAVTSAVMQAKLAGKFPGDIERLLGELLAPKVNWKTLVKNEILTGVGASVVSTWKRLSRKLDDVPGIQRMTTPNVWFLVDTSGSIGAKELTQALSEIYSVIKFVAKVFILPWDARAYDTITIRKPRDIVLNVKNIRGGGGTVISPALNTVLNNMRPRDVVVIITDGQIADIQSKDTYKLFAKIGKKSNKSIFVTSHTRVALPPTWKQIKITI